MTTDTSNTILLAGGALGFNWLPVFVAQKQGIFARHGLTVELMRMGSVDKASTAVREGAAHMAITPPEGAIASAVAGGGLRIVAGNVNRLPLTLIAQPDIKSIEQLRGKVLGTSSLTEGTAIYTREMLSQHGLGYPDDYSFAVAGVHPARWKALQEGTIDAAVQLIPLNFVAVEAGYSDLGEVSDYIPEIVFTALIADQAWAAENGERIVALMRGLIEATALLYDAANDEALLPIVMEITQSDLAYAQKSLYYLREKGVFARALEIPPAALEKTVELMRKADLLAPGKTAEALAAFDARWVRRAVEPAKEGA
ncbi:ABC transporter substrate-binding protein [Pseudoduganella namucuonensis]|uniref:NitT/TauT family transport system substrate-binding protein n=1 Tax=Pseudoduganella namucuonensis TaxID=1035707 RepID=A0A1I7LPF0_9BURK|nr:ABC transporter substrate-binding protein [Pseudoduganella namucuonensis]SFV11581.1 NitT/TauT family transport system substrate-binding protein [Pseudoduganella namucuonensis]